MRRDRRRRCYSGTLAAQKPECVKRKMHKTARAGIHGSKLFIRLILQSPVSADCPVTLPVGIF